MTAAFARLRRRRRTRGPGWTSASVWARRRSDVATGYGAVWLVNNEVLQKIDPERNRTVLSSPPEVGEGGLGLRCRCRIRVVNGGARSGAGALRSALGEAQRRCASRSAGPSDVAVGEGAVWALSGTGGSVARVDPESLRVTDMTRVGSEPSSVAAGNGAVWVANLGDDTVTSPRSARSRQSRSADAPAGIAVGGDAVWVANSGDGSVSRIDPRTGRGHRDGEGRRGRARPMSQPGRTPYG